MTGLRHTMTAAPIGYYVHHHGAGHAHRFAHIETASDRALVPISELDLPGSLILPSDVVSNTSDATASGALHWAPIGNKQLAERSLAFGRWLTEAEPAGVVVDVSVEAALLCRLFGVPTMLVRQHGDRGDPIHTVAYRTARSLLAPFPEVLEHHSTPRWVREKTIYAGFIGTPHNDAIADLAETDADGPAADDVVIVWGAGGGALGRDEITDITRAAAPGQVWFAGHEPFDVGSAGVRNLGWIDNCAAILRRGPTVIGSAGNNVVADAATAGCALVVVPQERPFDEQRRHAESLHRQQLAAVVDPVTGADWTAALATARTRGPALAGVASKTNGAQAAATAIAETFPAQLQP